MANMNRFMSGEIVARRDEYRVRFGMVVSNGSSEARFGAIDCVLYEK